MENENGNVYTTEAPERTAEEVTDEIRFTRHKAEIPLYVVCIVLGAFALTRGLLFGHVSTGGGYYSLLRTVLRVTGLLSGLGGLIGLAVATLVRYYTTYANLMSYAVRVNETHFPEIYAKVQEYTRLLGLKKEPEVYVRQQNGNVNAFTSWVPGKTVIQLNSEIVDLAYMENRDFDTVFFVMAHEFGHVALHHVQLRYTLWGMLAAFIPVVGPLVLLPLLSRAREYSCDRVAQVLTEEKNQEECMMLLSAGRHLYKYIDAHEYILSVTRLYTVPERFFRWVVNFVSSHPIMPFRVAAILDPEKKSGRLI